MKAEAIELCCIIADTVTRNYGLPTEEDRPILNLSAASRRMVAALRQKKFTGIFDPRLVSYLEENGVFFLPYREVIYGRSILSVFIGNILERHDAVHRYFVATTVGDFEGTDFYESVLGKSPTLVRAALPRVLIYQDNIYKALRKIVPDAIHSTMTRTYIDDLVSSGSLGEDDDTMRLVEALKS